jgi:isoamylase
MTAVAAQPRTARPGGPFPLGATLRDGGANFAVSSGVADGMVLCLFDEVAPRRD